MKGKTEKCTDTCGISPCAIPPRTSVDPFPSQVARSNITSFVIRFTQTPESRCYGKYLIWRTDVRHRSNRVQTIPYCCAGSIPDI